MYSNFVFIDWEHSVLMMLVWFYVFGWVDCHILRGFSKEAAMLGAASSVVHWLMDTLVIAPSGLTLYSHGTYHFGLGFYEKYPTGSWIGENAFAAVLSYIAYRIMKERTCIELSTVIGRAPSYVLLCVECHHRATVKSSQAPSADSPCLRQAQIPS